MKLPKVFSRRPSLRNWRLPVAALVAAFAVTAAVASFASTTTTVWAANGRTGTCKPAIPGKKCIPKDRAIITNWNASTYFKLNKPGGTYKIAFHYRSIGTHLSGYEHNIILTVNGKAVDVAKVPFDKGATLYVGDEFTVSGPITSIALTWNNDFYDPPRDINFALIDISLKKVTGSTPDTQVTRPAAHPDRPEAPTAAQKRSSAYWAQQILDDNALGRGESHISLTGEAKANLERMAAGKCSPAPAAHACVKEDRRLLQSIYAVSQNHKLHIWHFTEGPHVQCSNHYEGRAADLQEYDGSWPKNGRRDMLTYFKARGADELLGPGDRNHTDHWHVAWEGSHTHCR